jgi:arabinofuranosyltransferase
VTALNLTLPAGPPGQAARRAILGGLLFLGLVELLRIAWLCDDSLITLRCVLNTLHGYGPNFNIDERVQAFTHPLWFLAVLGATWLTHSAIVALLLLSAGCSLACLWLVYDSIGGGTWRALLLACVLLLCKPYVDFSASGLENPLANVLILATLHAGWRHCAGARPDGLAWPCLLYALLYLTRADLALLLGPFMISVALPAARTPRALLASAGVALLPVLLWTGFSVIYYGSPVPNTAFAKLGAHVPHDELLRQGWSYLLDCLGKDLLALPCIALGVAAGLRGGWPSRAAAFGVLLYVAYVLAIGGDFMSGRFLVSPFVAAIALLAHDAPPPPRAAVQSACLAILALLNIAPIFMPLPQAPMPIASLNSGISDERRVWSHFFSLTTAARHLLASPAWPKHLGGPTQFLIIECGGLGTGGLEKGPQLHLADRCGLADPLLAHLPAAPDPHWRIGHFLREVPKGYEASLRQNKDVLADPALRPLYDDVRLVARGHLFSAARWGAIWRLNLGQDNPRQ